MKKAIWKQIIIIAIALLSGLVIYYLFFTLYYKKVIIDREHQANVRSLEAESLKAESENDSLKNEILKLQRSLANQVLPWNKVAHHLTASELIGRLAIRKQDFNRLQILISFAPKYRYSSDTYSKVKLYLPREYGYIDDLNNLAAIRIWVCNFEKNNYDSLRQFMELNQIRTKYGEDSKYIQMFTVDSLYYSPDRNRIISILDMGGWEFDAEVMMFWRKVGNLYVLEGISRYIHCISLGSIRIEKIIELKSEQLCIVGSKFGGDHLAGTEYLWFGYWRLPDNFEVIYEIEVKSYVRDGDHDERKIDYKLSDELVFLYQSFSRHTHDEANHPIRLMDWIPGKKDSVDLKLIIEQIDCGKDIMEIHKNLKLVIEN